MIKATIEGLDITISGLESVGPESREAAYFAIVEALQRAFEICKATISLSDHSLRELALMGHPYGFTHPQEIHKPDELVHIQSGNYIDALTAHPPTGLGYAIIEGTISMDGVEELDRWIQEGTDKMRARPWMQYIVDTYGEDFADLIEARILDSMKGLAA